MARPEAPARSHQRDVPLGPLTYCKIGGVAVHYFVAATDAEVREAIETKHSASIPDDDVFVLGGGANVLINDEREYGLVLRLSEHYNAIEVGEGGTTARIEAGIYTPRLVREAARREWAGYEFLAGVPGSLGGAIIMNAGIRELSMWDLVDTIETIDWEARPERFDRETLAPSYRSGNVPPGRIVLAATCRTRSRDGEGDVLRARGRALSSSRRETQPLQYPSWGSTFKNPSGASSTGRTAGALIDAAGLKGFRVGDAQISELHANFIVNRGEATASDALACIRHAYETVRDEFGIVLEPEVRLIGFPAEQLDFLEPS